MSLAASEILSRPQKRTKPNCRNKLYLPGPSSQLERPQLGGCLGRPCRAAVRFACVGRGRPHQPHQPNIQFKRRGVYLYHHHDHHYRRLPTGTSNTKSGQARRRGRADPLPLSAIVPSPSPTCR